APGGGRGGGERPGAGGGAAARVRDAARARGVARSGERRLRCAYSATAVLALDVDLHVEDHARVVGPDAVQQVAEELEGFVLVRDQRIDLGEATQMDALAQVVHIEQVLAPALVDDLQEQE